MVVTGIVKQYTAKDLANNNTISINGFVKLGVSYSEKDPWFASGNPRTYPDFIFNIDDQIIQVGRSDIYELTQPIQINKISFPNGQYPNSIKIDVLYCDGEEEE